MASGGMADGIVSPAASLGTRRHAYDPIGDSSFRETSLDDGCKCYKTNWHGEERKRGVERDKEQKLCYPDEKSQEVTRKLVL